MKKNILSFLIFLQIVFLTPIYSKSSSRQSSPYLYQIAACLIFQNETFFLKEWIEYHKLVGIEHFYLFNNGSTDNYLEILQPYVLSGEVQLFDYPEVGKTRLEHNEIQCQKIYTEAISMAKGKAKWLAIIDADEFIVPLQTNRLAKVLKDYENYGGVYINYLPFGTSHVKKIPSETLIIEALNHCSNEIVNFGKSIVRPERVRSCTDPHRMWYHSPYEHVNTNFKSFDWIPPAIADDKLLIYHYCMGDIDHTLSVKIPRRTKWCGIDAETYFKSNEFLNARVNRTMQRFIPKLRKKMGLPQKSMYEWD
jgi:cellulose synthase/poly-beta-1,6-N-acetylglucosamine synthase-like glycosyltransferase